MIRNPLGEIAAVFTALANSSCWWGEATGVFFKGICISHSHVMKTGKTRTAENNRYSRLSVKILSQLPKMGRALSIRSSNSTMAVLPAVAEGIPRGAYRAEAVGACVLASTHSVSDQ